MKDQYTGLLMKAFLTVRVIDSENLIMQLSESMTATINKELPDGWDQDLPELDYDPMDISEKEFYVELKNGVIKNLRFHPLVTNDDANIMKGIASQFQLDTQAENLIHCSRNNLPINNRIPIGVYKTMEPTVTGKCETIYDMSPIPEYRIAAHHDWVPMPYHMEEDEHFIEVVKTLNYSSCDANLGYHFGITSLSHQNPSVNRMGEWFTRSNVHRAVLTGRLQNYTVQSSITINKVVVSPELFDTEKGMVVSRVNVTLNDVRRMHTDFHKGGDYDDFVVTSLFYQYNNVTYDDNKIQEYKGAEWGSQPRRYKG